MTSATTSLHLFHVLDVRAIWIKEFASALSRQVQTYGWMPHISALGRFRNNEWEEQLQDPPLRLRHFPLQRGFARPWSGRLLGEPRRIARRLRRLSGHAAHSALICTAPAYAEVATVWPGPVIYYVTDAFYAPGYTNDPDSVTALDRQMCHRADLVCPDSRRIADHLLGDAGCPEEKILVSPMATRAANLLPEPLLAPTAPPEDIADLPRPIAGVIGNLAENMDWEFIFEAVQRTPWLSWVFVGPTDMVVRDREQRRCRLALMNQGGRVRFTGYKPYGRLRDYARALDVAVLPYRKREPTYSGSSTRFYEHLAACRPILATKGFEELLHKEPLLRLVDNAEQLQYELEHLRAQDFRDGFEELRWRQSKKETWEARSADMIQRLRSVPAFQGREAAFERAAIHWAFRITGESADER